LAEVGGQAERVGGQVGQKEEQKEEQKAVVKGCVVVSEDAPSILDECVREPPHEMLYSV
jgi:hypothetical protein